MRISTRAAAVVQANTHANMLMPAPKSMATPSGEMPALAASRCSGLVDSLSLPDSPRKNSALHHGARNGAQGLTSLTTQRGCALKTHKAEHRKHQRGP